MRIDATHAAITISGKHKGRLGRDDIMLIDLDGHAVGTEARPSAETALHTQIYPRWPEMLAVLHIHTRTQSVASRLFAGAEIGRAHGCTPVTHAHIVCRFLLQQKYPLQSHPYNT